MKMVSIDFLWQCETCFHHLSGKCDTWCENSEAYRPAYNKLKIIDAVEVRYGKWLKFIDNGVEYQTCSECNYDMQVGGADSWCPACGSIMDGE